MIAAAVIGFVLGMFVGLLLWAAVEAGKLPLGAPPPSGAFRAGAVGSNLDRCPGTPSDARGSAAVWRPGFSAPGSGW